MIKFKTESWSFCPNKPIKLIAIQRESDSSIWINDHRSSKLSRTTNYHDTWGDARAHLISRAETKHRLALEALNYAELQLVKFRAIPETQSDNEE